MPTTMSTWMLAGGRRPPRTAAGGDRRAALVWCLCHAAIALALFGGPMAAAVGALPAGFRWPMWPAFVVEAATVALAVFLVTLPFSLSRRAYLVAVPLVTGLGTLALVVDAVLFRLVGFHINAFFFQVVLQPGALVETGVRTWQAVGILALGALWTAAEVLAFRAIVGVRRREGRAWTWTGGLLALGVAERLVVATLAFWGGPAVYAAGQVMPLQAPLRMNGFLSRLTGQDENAFVDPFSGAARDASVKLPTGIAPADVHFTRKPDLVFAIAESFRADYLTPETTPRILARAAAEGAVFERHYSGASNTFHGLFSLLFGLEGHKTDAVVGSGRSPILFGALRANGYQVHLVFASSADWMGLKETVFGEVQSELETNWPGKPETKDDELMRRSARWLDQARRDQPVALFVFFFGTHFDYFYPPRSAVFSTAWDGKGSIKATTESSEKIRNRGRNSAHEVDWKLDEIVQRMEAQRGRRPLVLFTGDHGEEFREKGRLGHGSGVNVEQIQVPLVLAGEGVPRGRFDAPTSHVDVVPTLLAVLGDTHDPKSYADGISAFTATRDRFVLSTVGWEPRYAAIGWDTKVLFSPLDVSFRRVELTDPFDRPVPDASARFARAAPAILRMLGRDAPRAGGEARAAR
jgi:membrane-anchored protein YejM (alkaline phosphatase superfamily)